MELVERYLKTRVNARPNTLSGYKTVTKILSNESFAQKKISNVKT